MYRCFSAASIRRCPSDIDGVRHRDPEKSIIPVDPKFGPWVHFGV